MKRATLLLLALGACAGRPTRPEGCPGDFVAVDRGDYEWRVMSAHGVVVAKRLFARERDETLEFVATVTQREFEGARGYALQSSEKIVTGSTAGQLMLFAAGEAATYLVAVFTTERSIVIVEAGGTREAFEVDVQAVRAWIARMKL